MAKRINYASLYTLRSDGRYQGYWHELDANGEPKGKRHTICDRDPKRLYERIQERETARSVTFADVAESWRTEHAGALSAHTQHSYNHIVDVLLEIHGEQPISAVGAPEINREIMSMAAKKYASKTVRMYRSVYKMIFDHAILKGHISANPVLSVSTPRNLPRMAREAPDDKIIALIKENANSAHFGLFPLFLIFTGFRRCEALAVQWRDIDFQARTISCTKTLEQIGSHVAVKAPKTAAGVRTVPLLDGLAYHLKKPAGANPADYIFSGPEPMSDNDYRGEWLAWCRDVGLIERRKERGGTLKNGQPMLVSRDRPTITAHQLRHGYATILYEAGIDEITAKELLGHTDIRTTHAIYTHLRQGKRSEAAEKLNKKFDSIG